MNPTSTICHPAVPAHLLDRTDGVAPHARPGRRRAAAVDRTAEGPLLYRYTRDRRPKGAFLACTSWLIEALVHAGPAPEARTLFEQALGYAGHTGLLSEEVDPDSGALRGNIPQALSHLALIGAATALAREP